MKALVVILFIATVAVATILLVVPKFMPVISARDGSEPAASGRTGGGPDLGGLFSSKPSLGITGPDEEQLAQGESYDIVWDARGLDSVTVTASADRTGYAGNNRGLQEVVIAKRVPASEEKASWKLRRL